MVPMDRTGDNGRKPFKARERDSLITDQLDKEIHAELTHRFGIPASSEKEHLAVVTHGHIVTGKTATTGRLLFEMGGIHEREFNKMKQDELSTDKRQDNTSDTSDHRNLIMTVTSSNGFSRTVLKSKLDRGSPCLVPFLISNMSLSSSV